MGATVYIYMYINVLYMYIMHVPSSLHVHV